MKKLLTVLLAVLIALCLAGCGEKEPQQQEQQSIVVYTPATQDYLDVLGPAFEAATGIHVEFVRGASGEIYSRLQSEAENPQADVVWFPTNYILQDTSYFEQYTTPNNSLLEAKFQNETGFTSRTNYTVPVIIYNTSLVSNKITGYASLLDPELKGKIAFGNAASSSSAYDQLENMLYDMGEGKTYEERVMSDSAWAFVEKFLKQLDGVIVNSSSVTYKGVLSGEYAVGMSWDTPAAEYAYNKSENIGVCYMSEGVIISDTCVALVKNAKNPEAGKKFIDWFTSQEGQNVLGKDTVGGNPIVSSAEVGEWKVSISEFNAVARSADQKSAMKEAILAKYQELYLKLFN